jgi:hypothetical protein
MKLLPLGVGQAATAELIPERGFDCEIGRGKRMENVKLEGGMVGIIIDCRGRRPFNLPADKKARIDALNRWADALNIYPK